MKFKLKVKQTKSGRYKGSCEEFEIDTVANTREEVTERLILLCNATLREDLEKGRIRYDVQEVRRISRTKHEPLFNEKQKDDDDITKLM